MVHEHSRQQRMSLKFTWFTKTPIELLKFLQFLDLNSYISKIKKPDCTKFIILPIRVVGSFSVLQSLYS